MTMPTSLADTLDAVTPQLAAGVEAALSVLSTTASDGDIRERLVGLMRELVEQLRGGGESDRAARPLQSGFEVERGVIAARLLINAAWDEIERREIAATSAELRIVARWGAAAVERETRVGYRRLRDMLDAVPDHMIFMGLDGRYRYLSRAASETLSAVVGVTPAEMIGKNVAAVIAAAPVPLREGMQRHVDESIERARHGEVTREEVLVPQAGTQRWRERHVGPLRGPDGEVDAVAVVSRDIHDRKKAEARLQLLSKVGTLSEAIEYESIIDAIARLSIPELADWSLINAIEDGEFPRTTIAHRDPGKAALAETLLKLPSQLHTLSVREAALAGHSCLIADVRQSAEHPDLIHSEIVERLDVRSAMVVPFVVMGVPVAIATFIMTPESGRRYGAEDLALAQEMARRAEQIIENARLQQQLRQSETRFRVALEHANITVLETDRDLRLRWVYNARLGVPESELIGKTATEILGPDGAPNLDDLKRRVLEKGEGASTAFTRIVEGKRRHLMVRYEPLRGIGGIVGLTGATIDVTDLKEVEEQLERELGFRERMMGVLGHDLRNPVSAVLGLAGLLGLEDGLNDKAREGLELIERSARRMNEMIGTLLDFTRLRFQGALPVSFCETDLHDVARGVVAELKAAHRNREIVLATSGHLRGQLDAGRMAQLLSNLTANALAHGAHDEPVTITLGADGEDLLLSVSNRGPKIPPEQVERLFEPFQQGDDDGSGSKRGLGLGLFIVREIVRAHEGTIEVRSGELTTFAVKVPRNRSARDAHPSE
jgi:PAS domain S-box-containing protein